MLDKGDFYSCEELVRKYSDNLIKRAQLLSLARNAELSLYLALTQFGLRDYRKAQKILSKIIFTSKDYSYLPLYRTIRLVNLMILYELKEFDLIRYETRSIKRNMATSSKENKIERRIINFVNKPNLPVSTLKRTRMWEKIEKDFESIKHDVYEQQTLKLFNFLAWIESKIKRTRLSEILKKME